MSNADINEVYNQPLVRREKESVDDFEHLGLDNSPTRGDVDPARTASLTPRGLLGEIDRMVEPAENVVKKAVDELHQQPQNLFDNSYTMDTNLFEMGDTLLDKAENADDKIDKLLSQLTSFAPPVPSHEVSPIVEKKNQFDGIKTFLDMEREKEFINKQSVRGDVGAAENAKIATSFVDDLLMSNNDEALQPEVPTDKYFERQDEPEVHKIETEILTAPPPKTAFADIPAPKFAEITPEYKFETPLQPFKSSPQVSYSLPEIAEPHIVQEAPQIAAETKVEPKFTKPLKSEILPEPTITDAEIIFKKMGLDAWFHPERLDPQVESLIYWRDPTKSGPVFGGVLVILLALTYLSLISVVAYLSLLALTATISFRIYKNIVQAVQKTGDGHPFKELLEMDITLPQEKVKEVVETAMGHVNAAAIELRRLFLVDDLVDSIKFGVLLWCLTYLGAWFNGMTLVIIAWVALFSLPKVYETNKTQIDANLDLVRSKIAEITSKVKAAIPIGKKEEKKEQ